MQSNTKITAITKLKYPLPDSDNEEEKKRKRELSSVSSQSELDSSIKETDNKSKTDKQKKKKTKGSEVISTTIDMEFLKSELGAINRKLENVVTKDDSFLKSMIRETISEMKEDIMTSIEKRIGVLESTLYEKQLENDSLKMSVTELTKQIEEMKNENKQLIRSTDKKLADRDESINKIEQYSRRNNVRIDGIPDTQHESAEETIKKVTDKLNEKIPNLSLSEYDFDIAHRLGQYKADRKRSIIVKFQSRVKKMQIIRNKKTLKTDKLYVSEDLTKLNHSVFTSVRVKQRDIVTSTWTREGTIFYRDVNGAVHEVTPKYYDYWLNLDWPSK